MMNMYYVKVAPVCSLFSLGDGKLHHSSPAMHEQHLYDVTVVKVHGRTIKERTRVENNFEAISIVRMLHLKSIHF